MVVAAGPGEADPRLVQHRPSAELAQHLQLAHANGDRRKGAGSQTLRNLVEQVFRAGHADL